MTVRDEIRAYADAHPDASYSDIARALGKRRGNVHAALSGYEPEDIAERRRAQGKHATDAAKLEYDDLVGRRFGRLEVVSYQGMDEHRATRWLCHCDCGREKVVMRRALVKGTTWRCGRNCPFDTGMVPGRTFGALMLVKRLNESATQEDERWLCRCECGNECVTTTRKLRRHVVTSCGCGINKRRESTVNDTRLGMLGDKPPANNSTGVRGVSLYAGDGKYHAAIRFRGVQHTIGSFERLEDAAEARRECERLIWGPALRSNGEEYPSHAECRQIIMDLRRRYQQRAVRRPEHF